jgi:mannose-6-phosphate isomerase-like protein (cupin superfamily)
MTESGAVLGPGEGRQFATGVDTAFVKVESNVADFSVFESVHGPNPAGVPMHRHGSYDEAFFIIEGQMQFEVGDRKELCGPGTFVFVPRGQAHRFANPGPSQARVLVIGSPRVQSLVEEVAPLVNARPPDLAAVTAAFARHNSELLQ